MPLQHMIIRVFIFCLQELFPFVTEKLQTLWIRALASSCICQIYDILAPQAGNEEDVREGYPAKMKNLRRA